MAVAKSGAAGITLLSIRQTPNFESDGSPFVKSRNGHATAGGKKNREHKKGAYIAVSPLSDLVPVVGLEPTRFKGAGF